MPIKAKAVGGCAKFFDSELNQALGGCVASGSQHISDMPRLGAAIHERLDQRG